MLTGEQRRVAECGFQLTRQRVGAVELLSDRGPGVAGLHRVVRRYRDIGWVGQICGKTDERGTRGQRWIAESGLQLTRPRADAVELLCDRGPGITSLHGVVRLHRNGGCRVVEEACRNARELRTGGERGISQSGLQRRTGVRITGTVEKLGNARPGIPDLHRVVGRDRDQAGRRNRQHLPCREHRIAQRCLQRACGTGAPIEGLRDAGPGVARLHDVGLQFNGSRRHVTQARRNVGELLTRAECWVT